MTANKDNITLRSDKASPLTQAEVDQNFQESKNAIDELGRRVVIRENRGDLKSRDNEVGWYIQLSGLTANDDGRGGLYIVKEPNTGTADDETIIALDNGNQAHLVSKTTSDSVSTTTGSQTLSNALDQRVIYVDTIADLHALPTSELVDGQQVQVKEYHSGYKVGGGIFYWDANSTDKHFPGMVVKLPSVDTGRWIRRESYRLSATYFGAIGNNESHTLSEFHTSLTEAQYDYPHATSLTDEVDWCAWQSMAEFFYERDVLDTDTNNFSSGSAIVDGQFVVNKTITFNMTSIEIEGVNPGNRALKGSVSGFVYNGVDGTIDEPIWIADFYIQDEFGNPPPGKVKNSAFSGTKVLLRNINFLGKGEGNPYSPNGDESGFISGVRIRKAQFSRLDGCIFGGNLWDGVVFTDDQLFMTIRDCYFYGIYRDAVSILKGRNSFSTTCWIYNNEFAFIGRYHILGDFSGEIDAFPIIRDNDFELGIEGFFTKNNEWFVHGVVSPICLISGSLGRLDANRFEAITDAYPDYWADIHLVGGLNTSITNSVLRNLFISAQTTAGQVRTDELITYQDTYGYRDITDSRNYNCRADGEGGSGFTKDLVLDNIYNLNKLIAAGSQFGEDMKLNKVNAILLNVPVVQGTYAKRVDPRTSSTATLDITLTFYATDSTLTTSNDGRIYYKYGDRNNGSVEIRHLSLYGVWAPSTEYSHTVEGNGLSNLRSPTTFNGYVYQCISSGTSGTSEPIWPTTLGETVVDGGCTWICAGTDQDIDFISTNGKDANLILGKATYLDNEPPTVGSHNLGDKIMNTASYTGNYIGWVCVQSGIPGNWKGYGTIDTVA